MNREQGIRHQKLFSMLLLSGMVFFVLISGLYQAVWSSPAYQLKNNAFSAGGFSKDRVWQNETWRYNEDLINILLLGIDKRGLLRQETIPGNYEAGQADAVYLVSLDEKARTVKVIMLPRNMMVPLEKYDENGEVCESFVNQLCLQYPFSGGGEAGLLKMKEKVSGVLGGIPIHGCFASAISAAGLFVDAMGGVEVELPEDLLGLNPAYKRGEIVHLNGHEAYAYLHYRDTTVLGSPVMRLDRQKAFLLDVLREFRKTPGQASLIAENLNHRLKPYISTDLTPEEVLFLVGSLMNIPLEEGCFYKPEGESRLVINDAGRRFDDFYVDEESLEEIVIRVFYPFPQE